MPIPGSGVLLRTPSIFPRNPQQQELLEHAKKTLEGNWTGNFTIPASTLYPHQWSWDAAFIAIGNSYFNTERAIKELEFLFDAQWKNGMVPHIVFNEKEKTYFPAADFYDITRSPNAPKHIGTSGMTQPPVHAVTYWRGPVWVNTNWMIWLGLLKYGHKEVANPIKEGIIELVTNHGFREYYNPFTGEGLGGKGFSWTAALVIDMIKNKGIGIPPDSKKS